MITIKKYDDFNRVQDVWKKLADENADTSVYQSEEYIRVVWNHIAIYKMILRETPVFFLFYEDETPVMILPLYKKWFHDDYCLFGYKTGCGYLDAVYSKSMTVAKLHTCLLLLKENGISDIHALHIRENSLLARYLEQYGNNNKKTECVIIQLSDTFEEYAMKLSKSTRQNIRTAYNRLETDQKPYKLVKYEGDELNHRLIRQLLRLYEERQIQHYNKAGGLLYRVFIRHIDIGTICKKELHDKTTSYVLFIDNQPAAYFDALYEGHGIVVPRLAIDEKFRRYSPGIILLNETIKLLYNEGRRIEYIDLTHGNEKYKLSMGGTVHYCIEGILG